MDNKEPLIESLFCFVADFIRNKDPKLTKEIATILVELNSMKDVKALLDLMYDLDFRITVKPEFDMIETTVDIIDTLLTFDEADAYYLYVMSCKLLYCMEILLGKKLEELLL